MMEMKVVKLVRSFHDRVIGIAGESSMIEGGGWSASE
jgi:hypothetical protein